MEPLYFAQITEKEVVESGLSDIYGHVILPGEKYFKRHYLKIGRSRRIFMMQLTFLPRNIYLSTDETYDTNLQLDININNSLLYRARLRNP